MAALRAQQQAWSDAESLYLEATGIYERKPGPQLTDIASALRAFADVLKREGAARRRVKDIEPRARLIETLAVKPSRHPSQSSLK